MELRVGARAFGSGEFSIMTDGVMDGADIAQLAADQELIRAVRAERPDLPIAVAPESEEEAAACVSAGADLLAGDAFADVAAATGAALLCSAPERAAGVRPDRVLVQASGPYEAEALAQAGHAVLVDETEAAVIAVYAWLGARVFRTRDPDDTRQVLDMVAAIRGTRPPFVARRGLA